MIENQPTNIQTDDAPGMAKPVSKIDLILAKIPQPVKDVFAKFYANKKIFWPVTGAIGVVFLILILGLLFGKRQMGGALIKPSPTPSQNQTVSAPSTPDQLQQIQINLGKIKDQIMNFDVNQAILTPPSPDFKISF